MSRLLRDPSFPGFAWERTALQAPPAEQLRGNVARVGVVARGEVAAEPRAQCVPRQSLGTRGKRKPSACGFAAVASAVSILILTSLGADWRQFRGNDSNGIAAETHLPTHWSETENVAWRTELPGKGPSSPIVAAGHVIVTCSSGASQDRLHVLSFSSASGKFEWERQFWATGRTICQPTTAVAAPTPASDGTRIFALFSSNDLVCLDLAGNLQWLRGLQLEHPAAGNDVGLASSPLVVGQTVIVQIESQGDSFAAGFDATTGATRWQIERPKLANWSSPVALHGRTAADDLVLLQSTTGLSALDPLSGKQRWSYPLVCDGITSTTVDGETIYLPAAGIQALQIDGPAGKPRPLWNAAKLNFGAASPLAHNGRIYTINRAGVLNCGDTADGHVVWQLRLKGAIWGTPVIVGDCLFAVNRDGLGQVVRLTEKGEVIGEGAIGEEVLSSPAVADGALYIRGSKHLWKIAAHDGHD